MRELALIFREKRDQLHSRWIAALRGAVGDDYREVLESPIGDRLLKMIVEDLVTLSQAEAYEVDAAMRRIEMSAFEEAARRARIGFELNDVLAGLQLIRSAMWKVLGDAVVVGELSWSGETMDQMAEVDAFLDRLVRAEVQGYLKAAGVLPED
jgi:hypothetical protein